jgi:lipoate-protein ligase A
MEADAFPRQTWRLLLTPPLDGASNMAVDEAILFALAEGRGQPTLRFYQWDPPCLSLGYNQHFRDADEVACRRLGYTWLRRPTGGRAILHTDELTYSIILPKTDARVQGGILTAFRVLSWGLLAGLKRLGADAAQANGDMPKNPDQGAACFDTPSPYEVTLNGKKLVGSAQARRKGMVLQHGTLPLTGDLARIFEVLALSSQDKVALGANLLARATTLERELGRSVLFEAAAQALSEGFAEVLNLNLEAGQLTGHEQLLTDQLRAERYSHDTWNKRL